MAFCGVKDLSVRHPRPMSRHPAKHGPLMKDWDMPTRHRSRMHGLGAYPPAYGTKAYWQWQAQQYQQQVYYQQLQQFTRYPYGSANYSYYGYNYPYFGYENQYQSNQGYQYQPWGGQTGVVACNQQGGQYDVISGNCNGPSGQQPWGNTVFGQPGQIPNVIGQAAPAGVAALNGAGYNVWLLTLNGQNQGFAPGYDQRRIIIEVNNGVITNAYVG